MIKAQQAYQKSRKGRLKINFRRPLHLGVVSVC